MSNLDSRNRNNTRWIRNALIEEITRVDQFWHVKISHGVPGRFQMIHMELLVLIVGNDTVIRNENRQSLRVRDLRVGMRIDAEVSERMTFSVPPQAQAFRIIVRNRPVNFTVREGRIIDVNTRNNFLLVGNRNNAFDLIRFVINADTVILNRMGRQIRLRDLRVGQNVRVEHGNFQTASIPPQSTAFRVQVI